MLNKQLTKEILKRGNSGSIPHDTSKVSQPKRRKEDLSVSQNLLYYSWNIVLHMEFCAWAQPESSATTTPCKKRLGISELFPCHYLLTRLGTPAPAPSALTALMGNSAAEVSLAGSCPVLRTANSLETVEFGEHKLPRQRPRLAGCKIQCMFESWRKASC